MSKYRRAGGICMTDIISRSISRGQGHPPGSPDRQVSALGYVTDCAMRPVGIYR